MATVAKRTELPSVVDPRVELALFVVREHLGPPANLVFQVLIQRETLGTSLMVLLETCVAQKLSEEAARAALVLLMMQNLVTCEKPGRTSVLGKRKVTSAQDGLGDILNKAVPAQDLKHLLYFPSVMAVLFRLRFPALIEEAAEAAKRHSWAAAAAPIMELACMEGRVGRELLQTRVGPHLQGSTAEQERAVSAALAGLLDKGLLETAQSTGEEYWKVSYMGVVRNSRVEDCVKLARDNFGSHGVEVMRALIDCCGDDDWADPETVAASVPHAIGGEEIMRILEGMVDEELARENEGQAGLYCPDWTTMTHTVQSKIMEAVLYDKFGQAGCRLYNLLLKKGQLEESLITDVALIPAVIVNERLHKMFKDEYVVLSEIPKTSDYSAEWGASFYLWSVDPAVAQKRLQTELCRTIKRLLQRQKFYYEENKLLLARIAECKAVREVSFEDGLTPNEKEEWEKFSKRERALQASIIQAINTYTRLEWY